MNSTLTAQDIAVQSTANAIAYAMMACYMIGLLWFVAEYGNRPGARSWTAVGHIVAPPAATRVAGPTGWQQIGQVTFSPADVSPPILQNSPLYERTYASGKKAWRFWDDLTEEWVYRSALPTSTEC